MARTRMTKTISVMLTPDLVAGAEKIAKQRNENYSPIHRELMRLGIDQYKRAHADVADEIDQAMLAALPAEDLVPA